MIHPLFQQDFELITYRQNWGEERVWFHSRKGCLHPTPASWTDVAAIDPFVTATADRSLFRLADLLELADRIRAWKSRQGASAVKG
jgi:Family of unknown function (DUF5372)